MSRTGPLAVIPARGGSKRLPRKNIRAFHGKPIIEHAIGAALASGVFAEVMVSTDDEETAAIARKAGAEVPSLRSKATSDDHSTVSEALIEVLRAYAKSGRTFPYFACVMATAALVTPERLRQADLLMRERDADSVVAVTRFGFPIQRALKASDGRLSSFFPEHFASRSQDLEPAYHDCGQFFFCKTDAFLADRRALSAKTYALEVPASQAQDIDTEEDWRIAELKYELMYR